MDPNINNKKYFSKEVKNYEANYWRDDEDFLVKKYFLNRQGKLLVLGAGGGRTLVFLHNLGFSHITAIDIVPEMVESAKMKINSRNVTMDILEMDATDLRFPNNYFDYIFFPFHGIDYIYPDIYKCVLEAKRVLKKDGVFIYCSHNMFFLKNLNKLFDGHYSNYNGLITYRSSIFDYFSLKKYFKKLRIIYRISLQKSINSNWKDKLYKLFPFLDRSIYFICENK